jgi:hypothetical protein
MIRNYFEKQKKKKKIIKRNYKKVNYYMKLNNYK